MKTKNKDYEINTCKLTDFKPADYNPRYMNDEDKNKLKNSLKTFGLVDPIIVNLKNNKIIGGHQRYDVLMDIEIEQPLKTKNYNIIKLGDIGLIFEDNLQIKNEDYEKALNITLNNINGEWDHSKLMNVLTDLKLNHFNIELTGFNKLDVEFTELKIDPINEQEFIEDTPSPKNNTTITTEKNQKTKTIICPECGHEFKEI